MCKLYEKKEGYPVANIQEVMSDERHPQYSMYRIDMFVNCGIYDLHDRWIVLCSYTNSHCPKVDDELLKNVAQTDTAGLLLVSNQQSSTDFDELLVKVKSILGDIKVKNWDSERLWEMICRYKDLIEEFFPEYYQKTFIDTGAESSFDKYTEDFESQWNELNRNDNLTG